MSRKYATDEWDWLLQVLPWDIKDDHFIFKRLKQAIKKNTYPKKYSRNDIQQQLADFITEQTRLARNALIADVVNILENEKKQWLGDPPALDAINYVIESVGMLAPKPEKGLHNMSDQSETEFNAQQRHADKRMGLQS